jgi:hypothetical protein
LHRITSLLPEIPAVERAYLSACPMPAFGRQTEKDRSAGLHGASLLNKAPTDNIEDAPADDTPWFTIARSSVRRKLCS